MSRYQFRLRDSASFLMLAAAACIYVAAHLPHAGATLQLQKAVAGSAGAIHDTQGIAGTYNPSAKRLCVRRTRPGEPQATVSDYGPCLMVHWLPTVPLRRYSVGMV